MVCFGKSAQYVFKHSRNIVVVVIVRQAAAERNRACREHRTACRRIEINDLSADQVFQPLACHCREVREQFLQDSAEMALMALRARQDQCIWGGSQLEIGTVELEPSGAAAGKPEITDDLILDA